MGINKFYDMAILAEASYVLFDEIDGFNDDTGKIEAISEQIRTDRIKTALQNNNLEGKLSPSQANEFVETWAVVYHQENTDSGFSATLFQNTEGEYVYALRGTEQLVIDLAGADFNDIVMDGLAISQIVDMVNDWQRINASGIYQAAYLDLQQTETDLLLEERCEYFNLGVVGPYEESLRSRSDIVIDDPTGQVYTISFMASNVLFDVDDPRATGAGVLNSGTQVAVTGHSLGGHLAVAFSRIFPEVCIEAVTINGAGFQTETAQGLSGNAENNIKNLFALLGGADSFDNNKIQNLYGSANPEFVTMDNKYGLVQQGENDEVFIEDAGWSNMLGHGKEQMTDALGVYDLFYRLDSRFESATAQDFLAEIGSIFKGAATAPAGTFETLVNALGILLIEDFVPITPDQWGNREELYSKIIEVREFLEENTDLTLESLADQSAGYILGNADESSGQDGIAYRYALVKLNSFVILGDLELYDPHNTDHELELFSSENPQGKISDQYLQDRALFLYHAMHLEIPSDTGYSTLFKDLALGKQVFVEEENSMDIATMTFGTEDDEIFTGGGEEDHFYGMEGDDILNGHEGDDYLEGGKGEDRYLFLETNHGDDTLVDSREDDGYLHGSIWYQAEGQVRRAERFEKDDDQEGIYYSGDGCLTLEQGDTWILHTPGGTINLGENFKDGDFGIRLDGAGEEPPPEPSHEIFGDPLIHSETVTPGDEASNWKVVQRYNHEYDNENSLVRYDVDYYLVDETYRNPTEDGGEARDDTLHDTPGDDHFISGGGNDTMALNRGG